MGFSSPPVSEIEGVNEQSGQARYRRSRSSHPLELAMRVPQVNKHRELRRANALSSHPSRRATDPRDPPGRRVAPQRDGPFGLPQAPRQQQADVPFRVVPPLS